MKRCIGLTIIVLIAFCLFTQWQFSELDAEYIQEQREARLA